MTIAEPDLTKVMPWSTFLASEYEDKEEGKELYLQAKNYLESHGWCLGVEESYVGMLYPGIIGIFLYKIVPGGDADEWIWIVVGDIPPAYLTVDICPNPATALDGYIGAMEEWIYAVDNGESVQKLIHVNAPPTKKYADMLRGRLEFLDKEILSEYRDDLGPDSNNG